MGKRKREAKTIKQNGLKKLSVWTGSNDAQKMSSAFINDNTERLHFALSASRIGIWEMDLKTQHIFWDDVVYDIFGLSKSQFENTFEDYLRLIHPDDALYSRRKIQNAIYQNTDFHIEYRVLKRRKETIWLEGAGRAICDKAGNPVKLIGTVVDITKRKETEISLQKRDLLFNALSQVTRELIINPNLIHAINEGLRLLGEALEVDKVYLFENDTAAINERTNTSLRFEWNFGLAQTKINNPALQHFPLAQFQPIFKALESGQHYAGHVKDLPNSTIKGILQSQQILSILFFPIMVRNTLWGFVGFDARQSETTWSSIQLSVLRSYSSAVARALENKIVEDEKLEWKTRYELIAASSGQVIYDYDIATGKIVWGGNVKELLGYKKNEMGDIHRWVEMIHPEDRESSLAELDIAEKKLSHYDVHYRFRHKDKHYLILHDSGFFISDSENKAIRMLGMMRDVTEMKKAERELVESEERYRVLLSASFSGIAIHDNGIIMEVNQGLSDVSGYTVEELMGMQSIDLVSPEFRSMVMGKIKSGDEAPYDIEAINKNGIKKYLEIHGKNIPYKGKIVRVTEFRDVTARKIAEEKVKEQNERLSAIAQSLTRKNEQLEEFTQIVSHNLRSPAGNINSLLEILEATTDITERSRIFDLLSKSSNYLLTTLSELNDILKVKQDVNLVKQELKFEEVLNKVKQMMITRINETSAQLHSDFKEAEQINYPNIYLESIFLNLLSNSLKYQSSERKLIVNFRTYYEGNQLILQVSDNGSGINLDKYGHQVFKLRKTFHENAESRGVGLFLIKNQIEAMGGEIKIQSQEHIGTTFTINFYKQDS
ncbi:MAG TPA: PAS domain-containing protein [Cyclobacteriaceae bacterium]